MVSGRFSMTMLPDRDREIKLEQVEPHIVADLERLVTHRTLSSGGRP
jgi:hypothetical protein